MRPPDSYGHDAVMLPSALFVSIAEVKGGCVGGNVTGAHDAAATHCNWITGGPDCVGGSVAVGAVGDCDFEHPIANSSTSPQSVRVTEPSSSRETAIMRIDYSDVVPLRALPIFTRVGPNLGTDAADVAFSSCGNALRIRCSCSVGCNIDASPEMHNDEHAQTSKCGRLVQRAADRGLRKQ